MSTTTEGAAPAPAPAATSLSPSADRNSIKDALASVGDIAKFAGSVIRALPDVRKYSSEVLHQAGILILSSGLIIWVMEGVMGTECGLEASYTLKQIGAPIYSGVFNAWCGLREMAPYMWGYIFAAKVGCGLVAELGSMRISDEIDALEVMGVHSRSYLVGTRVLAVWIAMPFLYTVGLGIMYFAEYLITVVNLGVSGDRGAAGWGVAWWLPVHLLALPEPVGLHLLHVQDHDHGDGDLLCGLLLRLHRPGWFGRGR
jgi:phospholipid/cholesterol/gamma-HCH transport system permease protein